MTDIINRAKRLFENRYHDEPWLALLDSSQERFWIETDNFTEVCGDFVSEDDTRLAAAAPELAQALAEESYEYIAEWCDNGVWAPIEMEMFDGTFPNLQAARGYIKVAKTRGPYEDTRIVRRRVSPPEVINE